MTMNKRFFVASLSMIMAICLAVTDNTNAAPARTSVRNAPVSRKSNASISKPTTKAEEKVVETVAEPVVEKKSEPEQEFVIINKSSEFDVAVSAIIDSASSDNSFAEQIRKQRAALAAKDASDAASSAQKNAAATNSNTCDKDLRKCMQTKCGNDFTKCTLDGDTIFGDKLNACRRDTTCTGEEFRLFTAEIKADRDMNARLASYEGVINCGNQYNACIVNECGTTYNKCLGKAKSDAAIQKCSTIAKECTESDSGLSSRFGTAIGKLRENAEKEVKKDEERLYALRDLMSNACKKLGAMFDERSFDCVYTVNFFAGENQSTPTASRKAYAGDSFVCMQEWFGINATTYKENAFRETRAQTAASSAMLGSGVGTAVGLISSGAINRALDTQKAKKSLKKECNAQGGKLKKGECIMKNDKRYNDGTPEDSDEEETVPEETATPENTTATPEKTDAEKLREKVDNMDIKDVQKQNIHNDLEAAKKRGTEAVLGDQRSALEKASAAAVGDHSLKKPAALSTPAPSSIGSGSLGSVGTSTPLTLTKPELKPSIGFRAGK